MTVYLDTPDNYTLLHRGRLNFFFIRDNCLHSFGLPIRLLPLLIAKRDLPGRYPNLVGCHDVVIISVFGYATKPTDYVIGTNLANSRYQ